MKKLKLDYAKIAQQYLDDKWPKNEGGQHILYWLGGKEQQRERFLYLHKADQRLYLLDDHHLIRLLGLWLLDKFPLHLNKFGRYDSVHNKRVLRCVKDIVRVGRPEGRFC